MRESIHTRSRRLAARLLAALAVLAIAGCESSAEPSEEAEAVGADAGIIAQSEAAGIDWAWPAEEIEGLTQRLVGEGAEAAVIVHPEGQEPPPRAAIYLHTWQPNPPSLYRPHLADLIRRGYAVVYPVYRLADTPTGQTRGNAIAGIESALEELRPNPGSLIAIGDVAGAAIAFDYAALAADRGLPAPRQLVAIHPDRSPEGPIPPADHSEIPADTRILIASSTNQRVPGGRAVIRRMLEGASSVPADNRELFIARPEAGLSTGDGIADSYSRIWSAAMRWLDRSRTPQGTSGERRGNGP